MDISLKTLEEALAVRLPLSIVAMRVRNPDCSPIEIQGRDLRFDFLIRGCRCIWLISL
jgi:hypothetical protein